jgi:protein-S-isoprenylcysteine O-methyltransferase Ste14
MINKQNLELGLDTFTKDKSIRATALKLYSDKTDDGIPAKQAIAISLEDAITKMGGDDNAKAHKLKVALYAAGIKSGRVRKTVSKKAKAVADKAPKKENIPIIFVMIGAIPFAIFFVMCNSVMFVNTWSFIGKQFPLFSFVISILMFVGLILVILGIVLRYTWSDKAKERRAARRQKKEAKELAVAKKVSGLSIVIIVVFAVFVGFAIGSSIAFAIHSSISFVWGLLMIGVPVLFGFVAWGIPWSINGNAKDKNATNQG